MTGAHEIAARLGLRVVRGGRAWAGACPACGYRDGFRLQEREGRALWWCASCNDKSALTEAVTGRRPALPPAYQPARDHAARQEAAMRLWGMPLPFQYAEGCPKSMECAVCPADTDPERLGFLKRFYPEAHAETLRLARQAMDETAAILERERKALEEAA